jgi:hypothetical protein
MDSRIGAERLDGFRGRFHERISLDTEPGGTRSPG